MRTHLLLSFLFTIAASLANAQKLPNIQTASLRAPANIKVDGKADEWNNQFQAYNKATDIFYTIANDDKKLYLVLKSQSVSINKKIMFGGITLSITSSGKKNVKDNLGIIFPVGDFLTTPISLSLLSNAAQTSDNKQIKLADSSKQALNNQLETKFKLIAIMGIKEIPDSLISIYNQYNIKAKANFDNQLSYVYELSIPLKYLNININNAAGITYNIKLNGRIPEDAVTQLSGSGNNLSITPRGKSSTALYVAGQAATEVYPTDFWGDYILAK